MHPKMKKLIILPLLFLLQTILFANGTLPANATRTVIATTGLHLRAEANTKGDILAYLPFGARVTLADECSYNPDTIGAIKDYVRFYDTLTHQQAYRDRPITGRWVKVNYGQESGFVFDAYLWSRMPTRSAVSQPDYRLVYPGRPNQEIYDPNVYRFYGVYNDGAPGNYKLKAVKVTYLSDWENAGQLLVTAEENRGLQFLLASKTSMREHRFTGNFFDRHAFFSANTKSTFQYPVDYKPFPAAFEIESLKHSQYASIRQISYTVNGQTQRLDMAFPSTEASLSALGDIDGDRHDDFIIESGGTHNLFLSSLAEEGQLVSWAAKYVAQTAAK